jgi:hypothetical protein
VKYRSYRMPIYHTRPGVPHYLPDSFPHNRFVTMYRTLATSGLPLLEWTFFKTLMCVLQKS